MRTMHNWCRIVPHILRYGVPSALEQLSGYLMEFCNRENPWHESRYYIIARVDKKAFVNCIVPGCSVALIIIF